MGILDALFGGGSAMQLNNAAPKPFMDRLTSGMGSEGGLLGQMGMGQHPKQPGQEFKFGQPGGLLEMMSGGGQQSQLGQGQFPQAPFQQGQELSQDYFPQAPQAGGDSINLQNILSMLLSQNRG